jgi:hypothetical protein
MRVLSVVLVAVVALVLTASSQKPPQPARELARDTVPGSTVRVLTLPDFWGAYAIWGSIGADSGGRIWFGVTSNDAAGGSAHLFRYDPLTGQVLDTGDVVSALTSLGIRRPGETQMKIHSRIVQMPDGYVYFASMDESGEHADGSKLPDWGGHLWRIGPSGKWEHLAKSKEALIAVSGGGGFVYALGYFNHVVYQYDIRTGAVNAKTVGSAGGHVSRNFFVDDRGHAFVPRVRVVRDGRSMRAEASLVELDTRLQELHSQPIPEYFERGPDESHGIVAVSPDGAGSWYFATGKGRLYRVLQKVQGPATLMDLGWYHPSGSRYVASMHRDANAGTLYGVSLGSSYGAHSFELVARQPGGKARVSALPYGDRKAWPNQAVLYGSTTFDILGRFYIVGAMKSKPVVLQVTPTGF